MLNFFDLKKICVFLMSKIVLNDGLNEIILATDSSNVCLNNSLCLSKKILISILIEIGTRN